MVMSQSESLWAGGREMFRQKVSTPTTANTENKKSEDDMERTTAGCRVRLVYSTAVKVVRHLLNRASTHTDEKKTGVKSKRTLPESHEFILPLFKLLCFYSGWDSLGSGAEK